MQQTSLLRRHPLALVPTAAHFFRRRKAISNTAALRPTTFATMAQPNPQAGEPAQPAPLAVRHNGQDPPEGLTTEQLQEEFQRLSELRKQIFWLHFLHCRTDGKCGANPAQPGSKHHFGLSAELSRICDGRPGRFKHQARQLTWLVHRFNNGKSRQDMPSQHEQTDDSFFSLILLHRTASIDPPGPIPTWTVPLKIRRQAGPNLSIQWLLDHLNQQCAANGAQH